MENFFSQSAGNVMMHMCASNEDYKKKKKKSYPATLSKAIP